MSWRIKSRYDRWGRYRPVKVEEKPKKSEVNIIEEKLEKALEKKK